MLEMEEIEEIVDVTEENEIQTWFGADPTYFR